MSWIKVADTAGYRAAFWESANDGIEDIVQAAEDTAREWGATGTAEQSAAFRNRVRAKLVTIYEAELVRVLAGEVRTHPHAIN